MWSRDGRELLFLASNNGVMAVGYAAKGDSFAPGQARVWTETRLMTLGFGTNYSLAPDGKRLAAIVADDASEKLPTHLTFLLNFFDELRRKVPVAR